MGRACKLLAEEVVAALESVVPVPGAEAQPVQFSISVARKWAEIDGAPDYLLEPQATNKLKDTFGFSARFNRHIDIASQGGCH